MNLLLRVLTSGLQAPPLGLIQKYPPRPGKQLSQETTHGREAPVAATSASSLASRTAWLPLRFVSLLKTPRSTHRNEIMP